MTEFIHKPYTTIYVRDIIKMSLDDLLNMMSTLETGNGYWADGVLFASFSMTDSEELAKKRFKEKLILIRLFLQNMIIIQKLQNYLPT